MRRALFRCDNCEMEEYLIAPVERPCPACGGQFIEIEEEDEFNFDFNLSGGILTPSNRGMSENDIDTIVKEQMATFDEELKELLAQR